MLFRSIVAGFHNGDLIDVDVCDADDVVLKPDAYQGEAFTALLYYALRNAVEPRIIPGTIERGRVYK